MDLLVFQDKLNRELAWRKREITDFRLTISGADISANHIFRSTQVMLCAHWEGFLKKSISIYLDYIFSQKLLLKNLNPALIAVVFYSDVLKAAEAKYPGSELNHVLLAKKIIENIDSTFSRASWNVNTEGNPGTDVIDRILKSVGLCPQFGLNNAIWTTTKVFINEQLVSDRHTIAHGEGKRLSKDVILERSDRLINLLDHFSQYLEKSAIERAYLNNSP